MNNIIDLIKESDSILLMTHEQPDGDAIGSVMAFYYLLKDMNKTVDKLLLEAPHSFNYLTSINNTVDKDNYDLGIIVDCSSKERIGQGNNEIDKCKKTIVIDHHISNTYYGDINHVEVNTSSCCQIIYYLFKSWKIKFTKEIAEVLILGMLTDTSGFANDNVDKKTFMMVAELLDTGVDFHKIYYNILSKKNKAQYLLTRLVFSRLELICDGKIAFSYITKKDLDDVGALNGDHEGLVDIGRNIEGVEVSIFVREDDGFRVSFRSNGNVLVNNIAAKFGGGGHNMAAGAKINGSLEETKKMLIEETIKELSK